jgi:hypothetical protein
VVAVVVEINACIVVVVVVVGKVVLEMVGSIGTGDCTDVLTRIPTVEVDNGTVIVGLGRMDVLSCSAFVLGTIVSVVVELCMLKLALIGVSILCVVVVLLGATVLVITCVIGI